MPKPPGSAMKASERASMAAFRSRMSWVTTARRDRDTRAPWERMPPAGRRSPWRRTGAPRRRARPSGRLRRRRRRARGPDRQAGGRAPEPNRHTHCPPPSSTSRTRRSSSPHLPVLHTRVEPAPSILYFPDTRSPRRPHAGGSGPGRSNHQGGVPREERQAGARARGPSATRPRARHSAHHHLRGVGRLGKGQR